MAGYNLNGVNIHLSNINELINFLIQSIKNSPKNENALKDIEKIQNRIVKSLEGWIEVENRLEKDFEITRKKNYDMNIVGKQKANISVQEKKQRMQYNIKLQRILEHLKVGYQILHSIRDSFTGQTIEYAILDADSNEKLFQSIINIEKLMDLASISKEVDSGTNEIKNFSLRLESHQTQLESLTINENEDSNTRQTFSDGLYNQILDMYKGSKLNKNNIEREAFIDKDGKEFNRGHLYEVIFYLEHEKGYKGKRLKRYEASKELIDKAISASRNKTPGWKGGDIGKYQLKNISNASAQIITSETLKNIFNKLILIFKEKNLIKMKNALIEEFTEKIAKNDGSFTHAFERKVYDAAIKGIDSVFENI